MQVKFCHALQVANLYARVRLLESTCTLCVHVRADSQESQVVVSHHVGASGRAVRIPHSLAISNTVVSSSLNWG